MEVKALVESVFSPRVRLIDPQLNLPRGKSLAYQSSIIVCKNIMEGDFVTELRLRDFYRRLYLNIVG